MASKKLIALSMLCYLLDGQNEIAFIDLENPELGFQHSGRYPFSFDSAAAANDLSLANVPKVHWHRETKKQADALKITFAGDVQWRKWIDGCDETEEWIEAIAAKRYSHYLKVRLGDALRTNLQSIYRVLFNGIPRKGFSKVGECVVDQRTYTAKWSLDDWVISADLNPLIGATIESVSYEVKPDQNLLVVTEQYDSFTTTHYVDLLLHSTSLAELKRRVRNNKLELSSDLLAQNTTELPITIKPLDSDRRLAFKLI